MEKREELYRGKAKSVYKTDDADRLILLFRNDTSAFDGKRIEQLDRKGMVNNKFNAFIMQKLEAAGIPTQFDKLLSDNEVLVKKLAMIPVECVVRNYAAGSLVRRAAIEVAILGQAVAGRQINAAMCAADHLFGFRGCLRRRVRRRFPRRAGAARRLAVFNSFTQNRF